MRINKYMADKQMCSRRKADELIKLKRVLINGKVAVLGTDVLPTDKVTIKRDSKEIGPLYFAYHKPKEVLTHSAKGEDMDVAKMVKGQTLGAKVFPIGRLDKDSSGLMILTNDGRITDKLLNPEGDHEKEYIVETTKTIDQNFAKALERGIVIKEEYSKTTYKTKPCLIRLISSKKFSITLTEGKKRQVRRMVEAMKNGVKDLIRVRIMNIELDDMPANKVRRIQGRELEEFMIELGMNR